MLLSNTNSHHAISDVSAIDSPALLVFPEIVDDNIDKALEMVNGHGTLLRPHVKTVKCEEVIRMAIKKGIERFKCSTIAEAELLGISGAKDVLLCYQLSEVKAKRFSALRKKYTRIRFSSLVDNRETATMLSDFFQESPLEVYIDVNVGMDRTGIKTSKVLQLVKEIDGLSGLVVNGLHVYDGHIHNPDIAIRKRKSEAIFSEISTLRKEMEFHLGKEPVLIIGGSPSFPIYAEKERVECSPGTIFFWDAGYGSSFAELPFIPAATILTRIVSIVDKWTLCFDLGTKATASDPPQPRVDILGLDGGKIVDQYEEHLIVSVPDASQFRVGEPFLAIPYHICPTVNLYEELTVIQQGAVTKTWKVLARDRKITI
ncbi:hypothetical protein LCGC14_1033500 [marine sediment metagenome]|uniref:D-TA family PLP-dependent enzyme n=2 Tax=root TaxID=1 RepID=A0A831QLW6_9FLAO|nr:D-TA family PLP-dependent enzyme [Pricia sp.]HEA21129.1 D-TA family PLP-dependent enzyme [Pricia antarctica]